DPITVVAFHEPALRVVAVRGAQQGYVVEREPVLAKYSHDAEGEPPQPEGILVACGYQADSEDADERVQLVGERDCAGDGSLRKRVARKSRAIVLLDGVGHLAGFAVVQGVVAAHGPL